jgi:hypothetical protein
MELLISGMHRSGTSLLANWLHDCGLFIGENLLSGISDNPKGHFEDIELLNFADDILAMNGLDYLVQPRQPIHIDDRFYEIGQRLVEKRRQHHQHWGWKDPRSSLLLDYWKTLLPNLKAVFVFRHYSHVVASLVRRNGWRVQTYAGAWQRYNQDILTFAAQYPEDTLVIPLEKLLSQDKCILEHINHWGFDLTYVPIQQVFDDTLLHQHPPLLYQILCRMAYPSVEKTYQQLLSCGKESRKHGQNWV